MMATSHVDDQTVIWAHEPEQQIVAAEHKPYMKLQEKEYIIIKYPHGTRFWQLPRELRFRLDEESLFIVWRGVLTLRTLSVHRIVAVQRGPFTEAFRKFPDPYPSTKEKSFSIFYLDEKKKGKYAGLKSLDLTCETSEDCNEWIEGLKSLSEYAANHPKRDPFVIWLRQLWCSHACVKETKPKLTSQMTMKVALGIIKSLSSNQNTTQKRKSQLSKSVSAHVPWSEMINALFEGGRLHEMYGTHSKPLHIVEEFLSQDCQWGHNSRQAEQHTTQHTSDLTFADFLSILRHEDNTAMNPHHSGRVSQDMTQPLPHYFINSSHNTYLEGNQITGRSACEAYIYALLQGCRCVEIDCWDDGLKSGGKDISIHHGKTFTSKLAFTDVVDMLTENSFLSSEYPVIISIENHCNSDNQKKMADVFGSKGELCKRNDLPNGRLPSPEQLKGKIVLKGDYYEGSSNTGGSKCRGQEDYKEDEGNTIEGSSNTGESKCRGQEDYKVDVGNTIEGSSNTGVSKCRGQEDYKEDEGNTIEDTDLNSLITYCRISRQKLKDWEPESVSVREIFNVSEGTISKVTSGHSHNDPWMVSCTEKNLVRVYPPGTNFKSANYDPTLFWSFGAQIVSLNFQKPDIWMQLNQGFFRQNGGCGYVLKPQVMRDPTQYEYSPYATLKHPIKTVPVVPLEIELISGQQLCPYWRKCHSVTVEISTYGIPADTSTKLTAETRDAFWPQWREKVCSWDIIMPELCLVYFNVWNRFRLKTVQYAQNCIPFISLQPGIRYVPLRTPGGTLIPESGIFVRITKRDGASPQTQVLNSQSTQPNHECSDSEPVAKINGPTGVQYRSEGSWRHSTKADSLMK